MRNKKVNLLVLAMAAFALTLAGCGGGEGTSLKVSGKIVDSTGAGIEGAIIAVKGGGKWAYGKSGKGDKDITGKRGFDTGAGNFSIGIPAGGGIIIVEGPPLAKDGTGTVYAPVIGQTGGEMVITLYEGATVNFAIVDDTTGAYLSRDPAVEGEARTPAASLYPDNSTDNDDVAWYFTHGLVTTNDDGTMSVVAPTGAGSLDITAGAIDTDADGTSDYGATNSISFSGSDAASGETKYIMASATPTVGSNAGVGVTWVPKSLVPKASTIMGFINQGTALVAAAGTNKRNDGFTTPRPRLCSTPDLVASTTAAVYTCAAIVETFAAEGTKVTYTPAAALTEQESYNLHGSQVDGDTHVTSFLNHNFSVSLGGAVGMAAAAPAITLDNQNSCAAGAKISVTDAGCTVAGGGGAGSANLIFPEQVWGYAELVGFLDTSTGVTDDASTPQNGQWNGIGASATAALGSGGMCTVAFYAAGNVADSTNVNPEVNGSKRSGVLCGVNLGSFYNDTTTDIKRTYEVYVDVSDSDGNHYEKTLQLSMD